MQAVKNDPELERLLDVLSPTEDGIRNSNIRSAMHAVSQMSGQEILDCVTEQEIQSLVTEHLDVDLKNRPYEFKNILEVLENWESIGTDRVSIEEAFGLSHTKFDFTNALGADVKGEEQDVVEQNNLIFGRTGQKGLFIDATSDEIPNGLCLMVIRTPEKEELICPVLEWSDERWYWETDLGTIFQGLDDNCLEDVNLFLIVANEHNISDFLNDTIVNSSTENFKGKQAELVTEYFRRKKGNDA